MLFEFAGFLEQFQILPSLNIPQVALGLALAHVNYVSLCLTMMVNCWACKLLGALSEAVADFVAFLEAGADSVFVWKLCADSEALFEADADFVVFSDACADSAAFLEASADSVSFSDFVADSEAFSETGSDSVVFVQVDADSLVFLEACTDLVDSVETGAVV